MQRDKEREYRNRILLALFENRFETGLCRNTLLKHWQSENTGILIDDFHELIWKLVTEGLIFLFPQWNNDYVISDFKLKLTDAGRQYLESDGEFRPEDPEGYLDLLDKKIPTLDMIVRKYMEEALFSYRSNCMLATAVMLGCASEKSILLLGEAYIAGRSSSSSGSFEKEFLNPRSVISRKISALKGKIELIAKELVSELNRDVMGALNGMADVIRHTRNEAGHPSGVSLSRNDIRMNLTIAAHYLETINLICEYFKILLSAKIVW